MRLTALEKTRGSETASAAAMSRGKEVENTHHHLSRASSRSCPSCHPRRRPCPPPRRHPASHRRRRRPMRLSGRRRSSRLFGRRRSRGLRAAGRPHCSTHSAGAPPPSCAPPRRGAVTPAGAVRRGRFPAGRGVRAAASGLWRSARICPAGRACLPAVSMPRRYAHFPHHRTCSDYVRSRHSSSCPAVRALSSRTPSQVPAVHAKTRRNRCERRPAQRTRLWAQREKSGAVAGVVVQRGCCVRRCLFLEDGAGGAPEVVVVPNAGANVSRACKCRSLHACGGRAGRRRRRDGDSNSDSDSDSANGGGEGRASAEERVS
jgi:hypothetical protein